MPFDRNNMTITKAAPQEYDAVRAFYFEVIDGFEGKEYHPCWEKDIYPAPEQLRSLIEKGELYVGKENGEIISAMAFNHECNEEGYSQVEWPTKAEKREVFIIHMLATHPSRGQSGVAGIMVRFAIDQARAQNAKAIRLDVLKGNLPANKLYEAAGFQKLQTITLYYPDTGYTDFELYELAL